MRHVGILLSAGKGKRMGTDTPKQYMDLLGKPVIYYSLKTMQESFLSEIIMVVSKDDIDYVKKEIVDKYSFNKVTKIVAGGAERSDSVYLGLKEIENPSDVYVYIHDGARPMLTREHVLNLKEDVECFGTAVLGVTSKDTVKLIDEDGFVRATPKRDYVVNVQTPQVFVASDILSAYEAFLKDEGAFVTDDASVMECYGNLPVHITKGSYTNIKLTTPEDFLLAEKLIKEV
ncbi:MAG: 2-C-methyl-D-erythritol 4-phosphate cytidylyltransferase [Lachnospiraceae bacterium]|nr:2-C-methyl-D-erythritol 4-phosphate cytidylyltransferase [Lachnospiraceae bacterium]